MDYGITILGVVPMREDPSDKSQMVSQLLFGEGYKVLEARKKWSRVRNSFDGYEGWVDNKQIQLISKEEFDGLNESKSVAVCADIVSLIQNEEELIPVTAGASLPNLQDGKFNMASSSFQYHGKLNDGDVDIRKSMLEYALMYQNSPYLWGGRSPFGIDCSGFTQVVYKLCGLKLPRDASQQAEKGDTLSFIEEAEQGDLAFFDDSEGNITHVGMILEDNYIIHASGKVRIDRLDHQGIFNAEIRDYSHPLRIMKRIIKS